MTTVPFNPFVTYTDGNGVPLSGGKIYTYAPGTTTPQNSYTDATGMVIASNPIILDSNGRSPYGALWLSGNYKLSLYDVNNIFIQSDDAVSAFYGSGDMTKAVYDGANIAQQVVGTTAAQTITNKTIPYSQNTFTGFNPELQRATTIFSAVATGTTTIPADNTVPQNTEGDQYMTQNITPISGTSQLEIDVTIILSNSASPNYQMIVALFRDSTANAIAVAATQAVASGGLTTINFKATTPSNSTTLSTFKVRAGSSIAGTTTFNGSGGVGLYGGVLASSIAIKEYPT